MSPRRLVARSPDRARAELAHASAAFGLVARETRERRGWTVPEVAARARLSPDVVYRIEAGRPCSADACARLAVALGRRLAMGLVDPRRRADTAAGLSSDVVHSAMGEFEASHLRRAGFRVGIDEPYQHFQFAGRGDVVAWDLQRAALLHIENKTRMPDVQDLAGSYNAKRAYLGAVLAERAGARPWASETHVIAGLWSAEVLHVLRLREASIRSLCPDPADSFLAWWSAAPPPSGMTSALIVLDPMATGRQAPFVDLGRAMTARPRYRGYADAAARLAEAA